MPLSQSTFVANAVTAEASRAWFVVDAADKPLGRIASEIAKVLRGKHKPTYTPHCDTGDHVIVVNADKVKLTGDKLDKKFWYRHSAIPGGFKAVPYRVVFENKPTFPARPKAATPAPADVYKNAGLSPEKAAAASDRASAIAWRRMILPSDEQDGLRDALPPRGASSTAGVRQGAAWRQAIVKRASTGVKHPAATGFSPT